MPSQTELRRAAKHIIAEELAAMIDLGWPLDDWEEVFGISPDRLRTEIIRQIEIIRSKS
jgi:hypothetical protein